MPAIYANRCLILAGCLSLLAPVGAFVQEGPKKELLNQGGDSPTKSFFGVSLCKKCHEPGTKDPFLCKCDEVITWEKEDKHKNAFVVLSGKRAQDIGKSLGWKNVASEPQCVNCHGIHLQKSDEPFVHKDSFNQNDGVSCVVCHGAFEGWVNEHSKPLNAKWRSLDRATKWQKYGLRDLWHPVKRAELCASCHIGNHKEGKVVTHAMYAFGHPPLPGFEAAAFSDAMPRHWEYIAEKKKEVQEIVYRNDKSYDKEKPKLEKTELVVLAGLVSFRETIRLLEAQARAASLDDKHVWPDFANYDCYACHHDLKSKSWRQQRGYTGRPGRPVLRYWPTTLAKLALFHLGEDPKELNEALTPLRKALDKSPFGEPKAVAATAKQLIDWLDKKIKAAQAKPVDRKAAESLLAKLEQMAVSAKDGDILDYDSARQVAWAYRTIFRELHFQPNAEKEKYPQLPSSWNVLTKYMRLDLPSGRKFPPKAKPEEIDRAIEESLKEALRPLNAYDPRDFREMFLQALKR